MLSEIITRGIQEHPENVALIYQDDQITYAQMAAAVDRLAIGLSSLGIERGDRISILLPNCPEFVYAYFAGAAIGAVVVPVNPLLKAPELAYIWADSEARLVITVPQLLPVVADARKGLP